MNDSNLKSSKEARAKRVKMLRQMAGLTRHAFANKYGIPFGNFQNWEGPRYGGLTECGGIKILSYCKQEGIDASIEWLMHGIEPGPAITKKFYEKNSPSSLEGNNNNDIASENNDNRYIIEKDLLSLMQNDKEQLLDLVVTDDSMSPCYKTGDYVAGKKVQRNLWPNIFNQDCIVQLIDGTKLLRNLKLGTTDQTFNLICNNIDATTSNPIIYDAEIACVAPVILVRKRLVNKDYLAISA